MGITGLLPLLKSIQKPCHIRKFAGHVVGIDAYGWLHRGAHTCGVKLALGQFTMQHIEFCMKRVHMLIHFGITPYLVFDGDYLPSKAETEKDRASARAEARRIGTDLLKAGKSSLAHQELAKAVDITPEVALCFIEELKRANVQYVVAPYEADAQMVYLEQKGIIQAILSEDSDLLVFGAKTLLTKLDAYGECIMVRRQDFTACREVSLVGWSDAEFRRMAILSGCDYLKNPASMGLKTAYRHVRKYKTIERLVSAARFDGKIKFPAGYETSFEQAERTFLYQWVYCPDAQELVHLTPLPDNLQAGDMPYIGASLEPKTARGIAQGRLNPHTKLTMIVPEKTKASQSGERLVASIKKRLNSTTGSENSSENDDPKKGKPIDQFFKKRVPLAELDPNVFRPNPSQQRLLEDNPGPFTANAASQMSLAQAMQPRRPALRNASAPRRSASDTTMNAGRHAPKRPRLCVGPVVSRANEQPTLEDADEKSHFFGPTLTATRKPTRAVSGEGKNKSFDFNLFSDDSVEDAMAELPDLEHDFVKPRKKMSVLADVPTTPALSQRDSLDGDTSQMTAMTNMTVESQISTGCLTPATSVGSSPTDDLYEPSVFDDSIRKNLGDLHSRFALQSARDIDSPTLSRKMVKNATERRFARTYSAPVKSKRSTSRPIPLPPIFSSQPEPSLKTGDVASVSDTLPGATSETIDDYPDISDAEWKETGNTIVVPGSDGLRSPSPPVSIEVSTSVGRKQNLKGSEDMLVPDSGGESEPDEDLTGKSTGVSFDLSKFAFHAGK
ncbi:hypothetical protein EJ05DRAFT_500695 [Pseudovirgaria hyperparasitica]|uniref:Uncharacterized protein n=1 Tax=Pseudovirgaria hyperparasitica TaxID=470096 RepID=A0A6A6W9A9_9PEZI|nr:uncharacterized protein EJ05DRAFT_500695 [Pseudovirgaria hyperparasitica]KAF2758177.1 hypothetical protein EJ05DRAFT_500695 [Pseudovirgaria hyperparasitica]